MDSRANKAQIPVPTSVLSILDRAISARRRFGKHVSKKSKQSEANHQHFVDALQHVYNVLAPRSLAKPKVTQQKGQPKAETLSNKFEALHIEEPSQAYVEAPDMPQSVEADCDVEVETLEEVLFALKLIREDYNNFRSIISESWREYSVQQYDLVSLSIMTNTAIDLVRGFEEDAEPLFSKHGGSEQLLQYLFHGDYDNSGGESSTMDQLVYMISSKMYDAPEAEEFFWSPYLIMKQFLIGGDTISVSAEDDDEL